MKHRISLVGLRLPRTALMHYRGTGHGRLAHSPIALFEFLDITGFGFLDITGFGAPVDGPLGLTIVSFTAWIPNLIFVQWLLSRSGQRAAVRRAGALSCSRSAKSA